MRKDLIGAILLNERKKLGKTIQEMADLLEIGTTTVSGMERGLPNVSDEKYIIYAKFVGKAGDLFGIEDEMKIRERAIFNELRHVEDVLTGVPDTAYERLERMTDLHMYRDANVFATFLRGRIHYEQKNYSKAKELLEEALKDVDQCQSLLNSNLRAICLNELGIIAFHNNKYEKARQFTEDALRVFDKKGERQYYRPYLYLNLAIYLEILDKIEDACIPLKHLLRMIDKFKSNMSITIQTYERYANLHLKLGMPRKALKFAHEALQYAWENKQYRRLFSVWSTLGNILTELGKIEDAKQRYYKALDLVEHIEDNDVMVADTYYRLGNSLEGTKEYIEAEKMYLLSCEYLEKTNENYGMLNAHTALGRVQKHLKKQTQFENTIIKIDKALENIEEKKFTFDICMDMCDFYNSINNKDKLNYFQQMILRKWRKGGKTT